jgi:hypothetical protein
VKVLAELRGEPVWALLVEACEAFLAAQDAGTRAAVEKRARAVVKALDTKDAAGD